MRIHASSPEETRTLEELEASLAAMEVGFDTGWEVQSGTRVWELDESLEGPLTAREIIRRLRQLRLPITVQWESKRGRRSRRTFGVGDVFKVPLNGRWGYGRVIALRGPFALVDFLNVVSDKAPPPEVLRDAEWVLRIYVEPSALGRRGRWRVFGNVPVGKIEPPLLWIDDSLKGGLFLLRDPFDSDRRPTSLREMRALRAQPAGPFGSGAAEDAFIKELRRRAIL